MAVLGCNAPAAPVLPGASIAPHLTTRTVAPACGVDTTWQGSTTPDLRYRFTYDEHGRLVTARGTYVDFAGEEVAEYAWDNLDRMVHVVQARSFDDARTEITAHYNTLGDLVEYTWTAHGSARRYTYDELSETGQPARQVVSADGVDTQVRLHYDARDRIILAVPEQGPATVYSYDDAARTITIDTGNGASRGVFVYDTHNHQLSETWDASDPAVISTQELHDWDGDRLLSITYRSGTAEAPRKLRTAAVETYRYDCGSR